jgi:heparan-alpha-glucosaminide N-acetyltransferase
MDSQTAKPTRITSIDAYRGLVMFLMVAAGMAIYRVAASPELQQSLEDKPEWVRTIWKTLGFHTNHVPWSGCSLHDLIQPSFSFLVGVALPFSIASRIQKGQGFWRMFFHAVVRALILIFLGVFLRSTGKGMTNFTFEDTLSQIGLGYVFLFLLGFARPVWHWVVFGLILVGYWALFALWPLPPDGFDLTSVGVKPGWDHNYTGFFAHWNINTNPAAAFDRWFLNLFGREKEFVGNGGGYATLSFIPTLATMILGLIAGTWMKAELARYVLLGRLFVAGVVCLAAGYGLEVAGICPIVKPIWTPAFALFSGGWCFLFLFAFSLLFDNGSPLRALAFPLVVIGANSIFIYCAYHLAGGWVRETLKIHLALPEKYWGFETYKVFGLEYESIVRGALVILVFWLVLLWMYRKRIFIKI